MDPVFHFVEYLNTLIPGIKLVEKKKSRFMRFLNFFCFFNRRFMTRTTTVFGKTIYLPSEIPHDLGMIKIIAHEYTHIRDYQRLGRIRFLLKYTFPQWMALFSLLTFFALVNWGWWIALGFLFFLLPLEASGRVELEKRAYGMTLLFHLWTCGVVSQSLIQSTVDVLHSSTYYWPGGLPSMSRSYFECLIESAKRGVLPPEPEYADIWRYLNQENYLIKKP